MPPLHPAFVHFPIALVVFSFIADLLGRISNKASLRAAAFWSLIAALLFGAVTAATGYYDMTRLRPVLGETFRYVDFHMDVGFVLVGAVVVLTAWRWLVYARRDRSPGLAYLIPWVLVMGLLLFQWWYGVVKGFSLGAGGGVTG